MYKLICLAFCLILNYNSLFSQKNKTKPKEIVVEKADFQMDETEYDFGVINENGGLSIHEFSIKNTGNAPLIIKNIEPECGCTRTEYTDKPIPPGSVGSIKAVYSPAGRPGGFRKSITVYTNAQKEKFQIFIRGNVAPAKYEFASTFTYQYGFLAINNNTFNFNVLNTKTDSAELLLYNLSNKVIKILKILTPHNIEISGPEFEFRPNTDIALKIKFRPKNVNEFGDLMQEVKLITNDDSLPVKLLYINSHVKEDFSKLSPKELKAAPKFVIDKMEHDFKEIGHKDNLTTDFTITNKGKTDLIIRKITRSCNCVTIDAETMTIKPKEKAKLKVGYTSFSVVGQDFRQLKLITNDPNNNEILLNIRANIVR